MKALPRTLHLIIRRLATICRYCYVAILFLSISFISHSLANETLLTLNIENVQSGIWVSTKDGCKIFRNNLENSAVVIWTGSCAGGSANGIGKEDIEWNGNHEIYNGNMKDGMRNGMGVLEFSDRRRIEANFVGGFIQNPIIYSDATGFHYEGGWSGRGPEGHGTGDWPTSTHYQGKWHLGKPDGDGSIVYQDKKRYDGHFVGGLRDGLGTFLFPDGSYMTGEWRADAPNGVFTIVNTMKKIRYDGNIKNWQRDGAGTFRFKNGDVYTGNWLHNIPQGQGKLIKESGINFSGEWNNGCLFDGISHISLFVSNETCR